MPVPQQGKRQRRWAPKVRTGCKTCKIRRKKCDEKRPSCSRCLRDKFPCDGYDSPKAWVFEPGEPPRVVKVEARASTADSDYVDESLRSLAISDERITHQSTGIGLGPGHAGQVEDVDTAYTGNPNLSPRIARPYDVLLLEPSGPCTTALDQDYTQYFLLRTAPLLSSTRRWQNFWQFIVPQAAWVNASVRHAMIAVSLTFDTYVSGTDHRELIFSRRKQAITAFATEPRNSWEVGLIICRLFSSMAQCNEDFEAAMTHMKAGEKMVLQATQNGHHRTSEVVRLMAATFMGLFADSTVDFDVIKRFAPKARRAFRTLQKMCSDYARMLRRITNLHWGREPGAADKTIETATMGFLSVVFTTLNQAISSAMYPDLLAFPADDGIVPVQEVRAKLVEQGSLLNLDGLKDMHRPLFDAVEAFFAPPIVSDAPSSKHHATQSRVYPQYSLPKHLETRLKAFVENYVVQAFELEPRMTAGTFWLPESMIPGCLMDKHLEPPAGATACLHRTCSGHAHAEEDDITRERREYYHEFVCQYRSGFMI
ncbi:hypothetical protein G647_01972 [Cladophialophora carrionii CBS 160.54]|uniref:Zn(2)-C6 fungal-type domain-containing protein n=1 Tax=Cladophialophora carrionii CBS 160.54 TaxID=1279043 RepID=V9DRK3_9EURO|nr:uncharacterized protein G647_01972 [Cladophialophora carrionii CBS 160.54]ETI29519.1 hypothetical protein G647_01972 [Cladophialophora carrionii CBS 160.54]